MCDAKKQEIIKYCLKSSEFMWAANIISILLDCDFRDAEYEAKKYLRSLDVSSNGNSKSNSYLD